MVTPTEPSEAPATPRPVNAPTASAPADPSAPDTPEVQALHGVDPAGATVAADAEAEATRLVQTLAANAVRRDPRALHHPLDEVAPWARALPPAAWRTFAAEVTGALGAEPVTPGEGPSGALQAALAHWAAVAAGFAETSTSAGPRRG